MGRFLLNKSTILLYNYLHDLENKRHERYKSMRRGKRIEAANCLFKIRH